MAKKSTKKNAKAEAPKAPASFAELKEQNPNLDKPNLLALADHHAVNSLKALLVANHKTLARITELEEELRKAKEQEAEFVTKKEQIGQDWFPEAREQRLLSVCDARIALITDQIKAEEESQKKTKKNTGGRKSWTPATVLQKLQPYTGVVDEKLLRDALDCQSVDVLAARLKAVTGEIKNADEKHPVPKISADFKLSKPAGRNTWLVDVDLVKKRLGST